MPIRTSLALVVLLAAFTDARAQELVPDKALEIELKASDAALEGHGPSRTFEYDVSFDGTLHVWAASKDFDPILRITDSDGELLAEDDNSGGGTTAYIALEVSRNELPSITVASKAPAGAGTLVLHVSEAHETEATRSAADRAEVGLAELRALRGATDRTSARAKSLALLADLLAASADSTSERLSSALWRLGTEARAIDETATAVQAWKHVAEHRLRTLPNDHPALQMVRQGLGVTTYRLGDPLAARPYFAALVESDERTLPDDHVELQRARADFAVNLIALGELEAARELDEKVLEARSRTLPQEHIDVLSAKNNLADTLRMLGDLERALQLQEEVLSSAARTLSSDDPQLQLGRQNLAITLKELGQLGRARELEEQVLEVRSRTRADDDLSLQEARSNLAATLAELGDLAAARPLYEQVLEVRSRVLPEEHIDVQRARQNLAALLFELGHPESARPLFEEVVDVFTRTLPETHPDRQGARMNLAAAMWAMGDFPGARSLIEDTLRMLTTTLGDEHPLVLAAREDLAGILVGLGEPEAARALLERVVEAEAALQHADNPKLLQTRRVLARTLLELGDREACEREASKLAADASDFLRRGILVLSPREVEARAALVRDSASSLLDLSRGLEGRPAHATLEREAFALVELVRSAGRTSSALLAAAPSDDPGFLALRAAARQHSAQVASLAGSEGSRDALARAVAARDESQRALQSALARGEAARALLLEPDVEALSAKLAPGDALVSYSRYEHFEPKERASGRPDEPVLSLLAFVVRSEGRLARVELGPLETVEAAVAEWRAALGEGGGRGVGVAAVASSETHLRERGASLRRVIFDPLRPALGDVRSIVVVADDVLHTVAFEALSDDELLLGERIALRFRPTLRELLWDDAPRERGDAVVVLGGARFDLEPHRWKAHEDLNERASPCGPAPDSTTVALVPLRGGPWGSGFTELEGALAEARAIAELQRSNAAQDGGLVLLEACEASRGSIELLAPRARILHLATHGWFAPEIAHAEAETATRGAATTTREDHVLELSPMTLCGLALAGANRPADALGRREGLVTAEEIASWDLRHCELAVLSACDTNVGVRRAGQGVASLQKALHMAGARSVITSLWKVPDEATKELMLDFYRRMWVEKKPKAQALWEAKLKLRNAKDERGEPLYTTRDWAAWVLTGDPR